MLTPRLHSRIFLAIEPVDMRKGFDSLAALAQERLQQDPLSGALFVFRNRAGDKIKLLYWDQDGYALWYKRLEVGTFELPKAAQDSIHLSLTTSELQLLLDGVELSSVRRRKRFHRTA